MSVQLCSLRAWNPGPGTSIILNCNDFWRTSGTEGSITINGTERDLSQFAKLSAYIMQDNQLHGNLSVEEAMNVATALKLGNQTDKKEKAKVVCISWPVRRLLRNF